MSFMEKKTREVELTVEGLGYFKGEVSNKVFTRMIGLLLNELMEKASDEVIDVPISKPAHKPIAPISEALERDNDDLKVLTYNPFENNTYFESSRLVAHKCESCGKITIRRMNLMESNITHCHWCKTEARVNTAAKVDIMCSSCGSKYYVWTANGLDEIECKDCSAPNDLIYYDNGRKGCTTNLRKY